jgi:hypothetical protein
VDEPLDYPSSKLVAGTAGGSVGNPPESAVVGGAGKRSGSCTRLRLLAVRVDLLGGIRLHAALACAGWSRWATGTPDRKELRAGEARGWSVRPRDLCSAVFGAGTLPAFERGRMDLGVGRGSCTEPLCAGRSLRAAAPAVRVLRALQARACCPVGAGALGAPSSVSALRCCPTLAERRGVAAASGAAAAVRSVSHGCTVSSCCRWCGAGAF